MGGLIIFGAIVGALFLFDLLALNRGTDSRPELEIGYTPARSRPI
jgi:hypothetical protein